MKGKYFRLVKEKRNNGNDVGNLKENSVEK